MNAFSSLLPATAIVAILVFIARESLELSRRRGADSRKRSALSHILSRECELNYWTIKCIRHIILAIPCAENPDATSAVTIERTPSGRPYAKILSDDGGLESHHSIPRVHRDLMSRFLLDIATVDKDLFSLMEPAYDALADLEHVRESLINAPEAPPDIGQDGYLEGFAAFALDALQDTESKLATLYRHCTGKELTKFRPR